MFVAQTYYVMIASPSDLGSERDCVEACVAEWSRQRAEATGVVLLPLRWELDSVPELGRGDGQAVINRQLVERADILIALFGNTVGTRTARAASGTVEEVHEALDRGVPPGHRFATWQVRQWEIESPP